MKKMLTVIFFTLPLMLWAQTMMVTGTVKDAGTGEVLVGANVVVERTSMGAATDASGSFTINNVPAESKVTASMIGYGSQTLSAGAQLEFSLAREALDMTALEVLSSRSAASAPVAYTNIKKADMELRLGSRDLPLVLNTIPSVFATGQGGGAGDEAAGLGEGHQPLVHSRPRRKPLQVRLHIGQARHHRFHKDGCA